MRVDVTQARVTSTVSRKTRHHDGRVIGYASPNARAEMARDLAETATAYRSHILYPSRTTRAGKRIDR